MLPEKLPTSAEIRHFRDWAHRFTLSDRSALVEWQASSRDYRLAIHTRLPHDPPDVGEFASIYHGDSRWASWNASRYGRSIRLWRARDGQDIGRFATMREALAAVTPPARTQRG